jgi:NAD(P)-dependent dehydrogenase (short-subunit alcohol dehydrogenase family)
MANVCVITGGGSGIGLATAKCMPKDKIIVISGRTQAKLDEAVAELTELGYEAYGVVCDVSKRRDVHELAVVSSLKGTITNVINVAGVSPSMADPETIMRINALGTVYVNTEFHKYLKPGSVIVDVASNSAYALPEMPLVDSTYELADTDEDKFMKRMMRAALGRDDYERSGLAYSFSKNFVVWYAQKCAFAWGPEGIRVCSVSPGLIETGMGTAEKEASSGLGFTQKMIDRSAECRMGKPEELGFAIATIADERNGYLAGVDILIDGGSTNGKNFRK